MKSRILFVAAIVLLSGCSQKKTNDQTRLGMGTQYRYFPETLKGKVKEMHETNYWAIEKDGNYSKGAPMTWKDLDSVGSLKNVAIYFDESGNLVKQQNIDENNVVRTSTLYTMTDGKYSRWETTRDSSPFAYFTPEYNDAGLMSAGKNYRAGNDTLLSRSVILYDPKGNYTKAEIYNHKDVKLRTEEYDVDEGNHVIAVRFLDDKDSLVQTFIQKYDDKGFMCDQVVKADNGESWKFIPLKYDDHDNIAQWVQIVGDGKFRFITERTYIYW